MKAVVVETLSEDFSGVLVKDVPMPEPGPGSVRIRIEAASVNFPDVLMTRGAYQFKPDLPFTPGLEAAGTVDAVGEGVEDLPVGTPVVAGMRFGAMAAFALAPRDAVRPMPPGMDFAQACAYPAAYLTAYVALVRRGALQAGETLLVHGAAGGVGLAAVDLGKLLGATVIATAGRDDKLAVVKDYGADHVINYTQTDGRLGGFRDAVKALTEGQGADVIYDPVGGDVFDESVRCIAWGGRLLVIGFTSGRIPSVTANMPLIKGFSVVGVRAGEFGRRDPDKGAENIRQIDQWAAEGRIRPHIHARLPLERTVEAMALLVDRAVVGKVVVMPGLG
ncbi:MAG: NADPH:quinone oxidoreductase family protein [Alphaproteobacteria bacterium]